MSRVLSAVAAAVLSSAAATAATPTLSFGSHDDVVVKDRAPSRPLRVRPKFMTFEAARWDRNTIRWYYNPTYSPIAASTVVATAQASFAKWAAVCNLNFVYGGITTVPPPTTDALIVIGWSTLMGSSSGVTWLDIVGESIVDADIGLHPQQAGGVTPLDSLLVHEIGHALGLNHSDVPGSVMSGPPYTPYVSWDQMRTLKADDITGCQALYGPPPGVAPTNPPAPPVCTLGVSEPSPAVGSVIAVTADCTGMPYAYQWTGCSQPKGRYCLDDAASTGPRSYSVVAANAGGSSAPASALATWVDTLPRCTIVQQSPGGSPTTAQPLQLLAQCSNAPTAYRWINCNSVGAACTATQPVSGRVTYTLVAANAVGQGPPASVTIDWNAASSPPPCGGFADVNASDPLCASVEWMTNRGITTGCTAGQYCSGVAVSRLQMGVFLSRVGEAMTPTLLRAEIPSATFAAHQVVCQTSDHAIVGWARTAIVRTRLTATSTTGETIVQTMPVMSLDNGQTWSSLSLDGGAAGVLAATPAATLGDHAIAELSPGRQVRFGIRLAGSPFTLQGGCSLVAELFNRNRTATPY